MHNLRPSPELRFSGVGPIRTRSSGHSSRKWCVCAPNAGAVDSKRQMIGVEVCFQPRAGGRLADSG